MVTGLALMVFHLGYALIEVLLLVGLCALIELRLRNALWIYDGLGQPV